MVPVVNNLESTSITSALSANMGRVLNEALQNAVSRIDVLENGLDLSKYQTIIWS